MRLTGRTPSTVGVRLTPSTGLAHIAGGMQGAARIRVGVVGCGLIAQVMHLPYLAELSDRFELVAVCDLSPAGQGLAERYGVQFAFTAWEELLGRRLDAVLVLTVG